MADTKTDFTIVLSLSGVVNRFNEVVTFLDSNVSQSINDIDNSNISIDGVTVTKKYLEDIGIEAVTQASKFGNVAENLDILCI